MTQVNQIGSRSSSELGGVLGGSNGEQQAKKQQVNSEK